MDRSDQFRHVLLVRIHVDMAYVLPFGSIGAERVTCLVSWKPPCLPCELSTDFERGASKKEVTLLCEVLNVHFAMTEDTDPSSHVLDGG